MRNSKMNPDACGRLGVPAGVTIIRADSPERRAARGAVLAARMLQAAKPVLVFRPSSTCRDFIERLISRDSGVDLCDIRRGSISGGAPWNAFSAAAKKLKKAPLYVNCERRITTARIGELIRRLSAGLAVEGKRIGLVIVDGWPNRRNRRDTGTERLKGVASDCGVSMAVLLTAG